MALKAFGSTEVLATIEDLVGVKAISRESLVTGIEIAISDVITAKYPNSGFFVAKMNRRTGEIDVYREMRVVQDVINELEEISLSQAMQINPQAQLGDKMHEPMPDIYRNRRISRHIADAIMNNIQTLEKAIEFAEYSKRKGEIVSGVIKKFTPLYAIVSLSHKTEAILPKKGMIFGEKFNVGDRINAQIEEVERDDKKFQITLSRSSNEFLSRLLRDNVPEIEDGLVEIKAIARDPGSRAKVVVWSSDYKIDPVGACIGPRASRIKPVIDELKGEKIDVILWHRDFEVLAKNVVVPAKVSKINVEKVGKKYQVELVVPTDNLSATIGRRGQNVRLASMILGADVKVISEENKQIDMMSKFEKATVVLMQALDIDKIMAQLLFAEGFLSVENIASANVNVLAAIQGFDAAIANEVKERAENYIQQRNQQCDEMMSKKKFDARIKNLPYLDVEDILILLKNDIVSLEALADLSSDELVELFGENNHLRNEEANEVIMESRKIVYGFNE